jgi:hypothetical protein
MTAVIVKTWAPMFQARSLPRFGLLAPIGVGVARPPRIQLDAT